MVIVAQVALALLLVATGIHLTRLLHDAVPSALRTGVASGVSTLSWLAFLPGALLFGLVSRHFGVAAAGLIVIGCTTVSGFALVHLSRRPAAAVPAVAF